ncbi:MAG: substrate-binding domain-containing protein [Armatimonadetes bacterium]|nr:substrate-binding domain-containing protein [Armatimonadota bacterium]
MRISGSGEGLPVVQKLAEAYTRERGDARIEFAAGVNTGGAIRGVAQGTLDLAVSARPLSPEEAREALVSRPFARDAVVFAVRLPNPVLGLSTSQVRAIYGGIATNWQQIGGPAEPIIVLNRNEGDSGHGVLMKIMNGQPVRARTVVLNKSKDMVAALESTPYALGYAAAGLLRIYQARNVRVLALDSVMPSADSIARGTYPWHLTYALISRRDASPAVARFVDFAAGPAALPVLKEYGYAAGR